MAGPSSEFVAEPVLPESADYALAEAVRKHPPLYNKNQKTFKDKVLTAQLWEKVASETSLESSKLKKVIFYCYNFFLNMKVESREIPIFVFLRISWLRSEFCNSY